MNLTLEKVLISGERYTGAIAGFSSGSIENCSVLNGRVIGKGIGECRIYIKNQSGTINHEVRVTVKKGNKFW